MRKVLFFIIFMPVILSINLSYSRIRNWKVEWINITRKNLKNKISHSLNKGWLPVGMSANRNQMFVFYIKGDNSIGAGMWSLNWYNDKTTLNKGIEKKLKSGYMPMGFTFYSSKFWVIYIKGRITTGEYKTLFINQSGLEREINKELKKDYFPVGITSDNASNTNGIIFVKDTSADKNKWQLKSHSAYIKTFRKQVINEMKTGWIPFSFIYRGPKTHVFYYKKE